MEPLAFRVDADAVLVRGVAHRPGCELVPTPLPADSRSIALGGVYRSDRCPGECPSCRPEFETLLSHQLATESR
jgi:hypothetical protein